MPTRRKKNIVQNASAGFAQRCWERMTASSQRRVCCSVSRSAHASRCDVLLAGVAGLVAGGMSMAAGEYVSVHSQADTEQPNSNGALGTHTDDEGEHKEFADDLCRSRSDPSLAKQVAQQLMAHDALGAHARDELGISETVRARPITGCARVGTQLCGWGSHASPGYRCGPAGRLDPVGRRKLTCVSRASGWVGCTCGWRRSSGRRNAGYFLGRSGHGRDCRCRGVVRNRRLRRSQALRASREE